MLGERSVRGFHLWNSSSAELESLLAGVFLSLRELLAPETVKVPFNCGCVTKMAGSARHLYVSQMRRVWSRTFSSAVPSDQALTIASELHHVQERGLPQLLLL